MKKAVKNIWKIVCYPLLYLAVQGVITFAYMIAAVIVLIVRLLIENKDFNIDEEYILDRLSTIDINVIMIISVVLTFLIMLLILRKQWKKENFWSFRGVKILPVFLCIAVGISANFLTDFFISLIPQSFSESSLYDKALEEMLEKMISGNLIVGFISIAVLGPIIEEIIFRGTVQKRLTKMMRLTGALILQAFIFGLIHGNILQGTYAFFLGLVIGVIYYLFDSIWYAIAIHLAFNGTSVIFANIALDIEIDPLYFAVISFVVLGISIAGLALLSGSEKYQVNKINAPDIGNNLYNRWSY